MEEPLEIKKSFAKVFICGECENYLNRMRCPKAEYKSQEENRVACQPTDPVCEDFKAKEDVNHNDLADYVQSLHEFKTMLDTHEIYYYKEGVYAQGGEELIIKTIEKVKNTCSKAFVNEVLFHIQARTFTDREEFDADPCLICLENGVLDRETMTLHDHDPRLLFLKKIPVRYDPEKLSPAFTKYFEEVCPDVYRDTLIEYMGYCLYPKYTLHSWIVLIGEGANGKSTFLSVLKAFLGKENVIGISLQDLCNRRFMPNELSGKLANICADLSNMPLKQVGTLLELTGGDLVTFDVKNKKAMTMKDGNRCKLIFSTNTLPRTEVKTDAYYRRVKIVPFPNFFFEKDPKTDPNLFDKLTTEDELSGILNLALAGLKRALERKSISYPFDKDEMRDQYSRFSEPYQRFIDETIKFDSLSSEYKSAVNDAYSKWAEKNKLPTKASNVFSREIRPLFAIHGIYDGQDQEGRKMWRGLRLITDQEKEDKQKTLDDE